MVHRTRIAGGFWRTCRVVSRSRAILGRPWRTRSSPRIGVCPVQAPRFRRTRPTRDAGATRNRLEQRQRTRPYLVIRSRPSPAWLIPDTGFAGQGQRRVNRNGMALSRFVRRGPLRDDPETGKWPGKCVAVSFVPSKVGHLQGMNDPAGLHREVPPRPPSGQRAPRRPGGVAAGRVNGSSRSNTWMLRMPWKRVWQGLRRQTVARISASTKPSGARARPAPPFLCTPGLGD